LSSADSAEVLFRSAADSRQGIVRHATRESLHTLTNSRYRGSAIPPILDRAARAPHADPLKVPRSEGERVEVGGARAVAPCVACPDGSDFAALLSRRRVGLRPAGVSVITPLAPGGVPTVRLTASSGSVLAPCHN
jgi:hypothetical protein